MRALGFVVFGFWDGFGWFGWFRDLGFGFLVLWVYGGFLDFGCLGEVAVVVACGVLCMVGFGNSALVLWL